MKIKELFDKLEEKNLITKDKLVNIKSSCCTRCELEVYDIDCFVSNFCKKSNIKTLSSLDVMYLQGNDVYSLIEMKNLSAILTHLKNNNKNSMRYSEKMFEIIQAMKDKTKDTFLTINMSMNMNEIDIKKEEIRILSDKFQKNLKMIILLVGDNNIQAVNFAKDLLYLSIPKDKKDNIEISFDEAFNNLLDNVEKVTFGDKKIKPVVMTEEQFIRNFS